MAKARICDICGNIIKGTRNILTIKEIDDETMEPREAKVVQSLDVHIECLQSVLDEISNRAEASA